MIFVFRPEHMVGLANGTLKQVVSSTGVPLSVVRDAVSGQIVGHAVSAVGQPFIAFPQLAMSAAQMVQTHMGFQKTYRMLDALQNSVGVLQATTAVIGVGTVAGVALSAVNLHQTLKLREDVKQLRLEVKHGFIDLKTALKDQGSEVIQRIDQVAQDIEYKHHRTILVQAYGRFIQALSCLRDAMKLPDVNLRNAGIGTARGILYEALADYNNPLLFEETYAAGQLRRKECAWAIDQAITTAYQLQGAYEVVSDLLSKIQAIIRQDSLTVIDHSKEEELDFLFPELTRIHNHDLAVLESWQNHVDWVQALSPDERHLLASSDIPQEADSSDSNQDLVVVAEPEEQLAYENLKQKSHYLSLRDQLRFMVKPDLRRRHETYINQQATASGYHGLAPSNWQEIPDSTVANLYWYFQERDKSEAAA